MIKGNVKSYTVRYLDFQIEYLKARIQKMINVPLGTYINWQQVFELDALRKEYILEYFSRS